MDIGKWWSRLQAAIQRSTAWEHPPWVTAEGQAYGPPRKLGAVRLMRVTCHRVEGGRTLHYVYVSPDGEPPCVVHLQAARGLPRSIMISISDE
jgi:hypothetical protein